MNIGTGAIGVSPAIGSGKWQAKTTKTDHKETCDLDLASALSEVKEAPAQSQRMYSERIQNKGKLRQKPKLALHPRTAPNL